MESRARESSRATHNGIKSALRSKLNEPRAARNNRATLEPGTRRVAKGVARSIGGTRKTRDRARLEILRVESRAPQNADETVGSGEMHGASEKERAGGSERRRSVGSIALHVVL